MTVLSYVANQLTPEGLDELQRVLLAYKLGQHVAIAGPPGVGKTELAEQLPKIVKRPLYGDALDEYMTEAPLIGFPALEGANGSSVTVWKNGWLTRAMEEDGIYYGDEFDRLQGSLQKRMNGAFDARRRVSRRDGKVIDAGDKFFGVITYNPADRVSTRQLEEAVADRFVHHVFHYLPPQLEAKLAEKELAILLEERGILYTDESIRFLRKEEGDWKDFFSGEQVTHTEHVFAYSAYVKHEEEEKTPPTVLKRTELADRIAEFFVSVRSFADTGTNALKTEIKEYLKEIGEVTQVRLHRPSTRIIMAALAQYKELTKLGMPAAPAQEHAVRLTIDQICYGKFGRQPLGDATVSDAVTKIAQFYELLGRAVRTTDFAGAPATSPTTT